MVAAQNTLSQHLDQSRHYLQWNKKCTAREFGGSKQITVTCDMSTVDIAHVSLHLRMLELDGVEQAHW